MGRDGAEIHQYMALPAPLYTWRPYITFYIYLTFRTTRQQYHSSAEYHPVIIHIHNDKFTLSPNQETQSLISNCIHFWIMFIITQLQLPSLI